MTVSVHDAAFCIVKAMIDRWPQRTELTACDIIYEDGWITAYIFINNSDESIDTQFQLPNELRNAPFDACYWRDQLHFAIFADGTVH
jgi:hypothetical protein